MIALKNITVKSGQKVLLNDISADFSKASCWVITGSNGSGKSVLGKIMSGIMTPWRGEITGNAVTGYTSFELQEKVIETEKRKDETLYMQGAVDEGTRIKDYLLLENHPDKKYAEKLIDLFSMAPILERGLRFLSTGEFRKVLLLSALLKKPDILVIDDPFDGLDVSSRDHLKEVISDVINHGCRMVFISGRIEDFPPEADRMILLSEGVLKYSGEINKGIEIYKAEHSGIKASADRFVHENIEVFENISDNDEGEGLSKDVLIEMINTTVSYSGRKVLDNFNWNVKRGEKWKISGVNGSGKSTLLSLVNCDNPQSYANDITLFGIKRGSGESVWDIKKKIGFVSGDFQFKYRVRCTVMDAVISGLYDSVGLYKNINDSDIAKGVKWLKITGLYSKRASFFTDLSFGEMRLALIARAMIKNPEMLILDEPCQGLDSFNRDRILELCEEIGKDGKCTILFVTHDSEVHLDCFTNSLLLEKKQ